MVPKWSGGRAIFAVIFILREVDCVISYAALRKCATWLMIVGVFVAVSLRAIGFEHYHDTRYKCCQPGETPADSQLDQDLPDDDQQDDQDDPTGHEHHNCCSSGLPLIIDNGSNSRLGVPGSSRLGILHEGEVPPDGPFLSEDKPPLI